MKPLNNLMLDIIPDLSHLWLSCSHGTRLTSYTKRVPMNSSFIINSWHDDRRVKMNWRYGLDPPYPEHNYYFGRIIPASWLTFELTKPTSQPVLFVEPGLKWWIKKGAQDWYIYLSSPRFNATDWMISKRVRDNCVVDYLSFKPFHCPVMLWDYH